MPGCMVIIQQWNKENERISKDNKIITSLIFLLINEILNEIRHTYINGIF